VHRTNDGHGPITFQPVHFVAISVFKGFLQSNAEASVSPILPKGGLSKAVSTVEFDEKEAVLISRPWYVTLSEHAEALRMR
jgi:hypothetical protein